MGLQRVGHNWVTIIPGIFSHIYTDIRIGRSVQRSMEIILLSVSLLFILFITKIITLTFTWRKLNGNGIWRSCQNLNSKSLPRNNCHPKVIPLKWKGKLRTHFMARIFVFQQLVSLYQGWRRKWQFLPGEFHRQKSLAGYSPWGCKELDTTEWLSFRASFHIYTQTSE